MLGKDMLGQDSLGQVREDRFGRLDSSLITISNPMGPASRLSTSLSGCTDVLQQPFAINLKLNKVTIFHKTELLIVWQECFTMFLFLKTIIEGTMTKHISTVKKTLPMQRFFPSLDLVRNVLAMQRRQRVKMMRKEISPISINKNINEKNYKFQRELL